MSADTHTGRPDAPYICLSGIFIISGQPVLKLSREYVVATVTIYNWIKRFSPVKVSDKEEITAQEYQAMKKRIAQLEMENEILKKATAIFPRKQ